MGEYPVPSVSWKMSHDRHSKVHWWWEFNDRGTMCGWRLPEEGVNWTPDRTITCKRCYYRVYGILPKRNYRKRFFEGIARNRTYFLFILMALFGIIQWVRREYAPKQRAGTDGSERFSDTTANIVEAPSST